MYIFVRNIYIVFTKCILRDKHGLTLKFWLLTAEEHDVTRDVSVVNTKYKQ
jgi:hypothetical protein